MSPLGGLFARLLSMLGTDAMATALARNPSFQRFALRIDSFLNQNQTAIMQKGEEFTKKVEQMSKDPELQANAAKAAEELRQRASAGTSVVGRFFTALRHEVEKDLGLGKKR